MGYPPFVNQVDEERFRTFYQFADDKLIDFLGLVGTAEPRTKFLVYSRGTDPNWTNETYRAQWVKKIEARFPTLTDRLTTMLIPGGSTGTFKDPKTAEMLLRLVTDILGLPEKREPEKRP